MTVDELIAKGMEHQENGEIEEAAETFVRAFQLAPTDERLPWEAARLYLYQLSRPADAVKWFEASLPLIENPFKACDTRYQIGLAHVFLSEDDKARVRFEEVLAHTPSHVTACIELGKLFTRQGDHERAKDLLQQAVLHNNMRSTLPEMFPDGQRGSGHAAALAWMNLGRLALVASDDEELGRNAAGHLLDDLDDVQRVLLLAKEARAAGKFVGAMTALEAILERDSEHEAAMELWLSVALDDLQLTDQVVEMAQSLVEEYPERAAYLIDEVLERTPDHVEALALRAAAKPA